jgi:integrase
MDGHRGCPTRAVIALRWEDIYFDARTLRVAGSLQRINGELLVSEPKTARSRRTIPLPNVCVEALIRHRANQAKEKLEAPIWPHPELVFATSVGTPIEPRNLVRHFEALCKRAGVRKVRFHDLRHTCASLLLAQGVEPRVIMDTLGHTMIGTTLNLYTHVLPATQRDAADRMDDVLRKEGHGS